MRRFRVELTQLASIVVTAHEAPVNGRRITGHRVVGAAERLHVTPSTVTARLQTLEREIGHPLVHRSKSGATPTAVGRRIRRNAETMLALWEQTQRTAALADLESGCHSCQRQGWVT